MRKDAVTNVLELVGGPFDGVLHELPCPFGLVMMPDRFWLPKDGQVYEYRTKGDRAFYQVNPQEIDNDHS